VDLFPAERPAREGGAGGDRSRRMRRQGWRRKDLPTIGQVAQLVEQGTENPRVGSSILSLATIFPFTAGPVASRWLISRVSGSNLQ
jgi:hypothetical protein